MGRGCKGHLQCTHLISYAAQSAPRVSTRVTHAYTSYITSIGPPQIPSGIAITLGVTFGPAYADLSVVLGASTPRYFYNCLHNLIGPKYVAGERPGCLLEARDGWQPQDYRGNWKVVNTTGIRSTSII